MPQSLPVPPLAQTLERYLETVRPLLDDAESAGTSAVVEEFAAGDGPACQAELERVAARDSDGGSWLARPWLDAYLSTRGPLPLTSSVGFEVRLPSPGAGTARAADAIHRLAAVHLRCLRGELDPEVDARGQTLDGEQLRVLAGGLRRPGRDVDTLEAGVTGAADREIVVLHRGRGFAVRVGDGVGRPLAVPALRSALDALVAAGPSKPGDPPFTAWSYLDRAAAAAYEEVVLADPAGAATHRRLAGCLFAVALLDDAADIETHLFETAFGDGRAWTGTPITYQVGLSDDFLGVHFEHSGADGATVQGVVTLAQRVHVDVDVNVGVNTDEEEDGADATPPAVEPLTWPLGDDLADRLRVDLDEYRVRAGELRLRLLRVPVTPTDLLPMKVSRDAAIQFALLYAQLATTGRVGSTYESVDMRAYRAGRTEALRPVTTEAVRLVRGLLDGSADRDALRAALDAHRERVVRCKTGQAIDRHLLGLRLAADRLGLRPRLFADAGFTRLTHDVLSTTSLGDDSAVSRVAFAPTTPGGFGVYYSVRDGSDELVVTHDASRDGDVDAFLAAITEGAQRLWALVALVATGGPRPGAPE